MKRVLAIAMLLGVTLMSQAQVVLMAGDYPDPSILKDGDDYYMTHTPNYYLPGFLIWHSRDLLNWEPICKAGETWSGSAWAPDLQKVGDTYYIYFPANGTNWVITAKDIRGPWTLPLDLKIGGIDPGLIVTPEGKRYLFTNQGYVTKLTDDGLARDGESKRVYQGWKYPEEWQTECMCLESPKMSYYDGYYYMTSAQGGTAGPATSHMAVCARAKDIMGPWENSPYNPIIHTYSAAEEWWSKGHGTLVEGPDGQWWMVYHAYRSKAYGLGRHTLMEPIEWTKGGWYRPVKDMPLPTAHASLPQSDDFADNHIGWQWTGWKENITQVAREAKGVLSLPGKGTSPKDGRLMLVAPSEPQYTAEVEVTLPKKGGEAGLLLYFNEHAWAGLSATTTTWTIHRHADKQEQVPNTLGRKFRIRLVNHLETLDILVSANGKDWQTVTEGIAIGKMHHNNYGDFVSLRPALYSAGTATAEFRDFRMKNEDL